MKPLPAQATRELARTIEAAHRELMRRAACGHHLALPVLYAAARDAEQRANEAGRILRRLGATPADLAALVGTTPRRAAHRFAPTAVERARAAQQTDADARVLEMLHDLGGAAMQEHLFQRLGYDRAMVRHALARNEAKGLVEHDFQIRGPRPWRLTARGRRAADRGRSR